MQNGRAHQSQVSIDDNLLVVTTGPLAINGSPQSLAAINASVPAATRIVCASGGLELRTECVLRADIGISQIWQSLLGDCQHGLDILGGESVPQPTAIATPHNFDEEEPALHWNARAEGDGNWIVPLAHEKALLHASASIVRTEIIAQQEWPDQVRFAVSEYLLRATSQLRFVKACATPHSSSQWSAWIQASPAACGMEEALTCVALACRECGAAVRALSELRIAQLFREISSIWRDGLAPISRERR
jgi:hypothetical protein